MMTAKSWMERTKREGKSFLREVNEHFATNMRGGEENVNLYHVDSYDIQPGKHAR